MNCFENTSTVELAYICSTNEDQTIINLAAFELARRLYIPDKGETIEELAAAFGYKELGHQKKLVKS